MYPVTTALEAAQHVVLAPHTVLALTVPTANVNLSVAHAVWSAQQAPTSSMPLGDHFPALHAKQVPALPVTVSEPMVKPTTSVAGSTLRAQHEALSPHVLSELAVQTLEKNLSVPVHPLQAAQQPPFASSPVAENWTPAEHGLQVPAAPSTVAEPADQPTTPARPEAVQQTVFKPQTTSVVAVPSVLTYSVAALHVLWAAQQALSTSNPLAENFPVLHASQVPALPAASEVPTLKPTTAAAAQHLVLSPHVELVVAVQAVA